MWNIHGNRFYTVLAYAMKEIDVHLTTSTPNNSEPSTKEDQPHRMLLASVYEHIANKSNLHCPPAPAEDHALFYFQCETCAR